ncbi:MAG: hypothetical protein LUQ65_13610 [Candidatus Helarchaeota archaeon]|nr:hypothetical protein [Candidatus Helarchaeota archaeon]
MKRIISFLQITTFLIFLASCNFQKSPTSTTIGTINMVTVTPEDTTKPLPSETTEASKTPTSQQSTVTVATQSVSEMPELIPEERHPEAQYIKKCLQEKSTSDNINLEGKLIVLNNGKFYYFNKSDPQEIVDTDEIYTISLSPNKQRMIIEASSNGYKTMLVSIYGDIEVNMDNINQWKETSWLNNNLWLIHLRNRYSTLLVYDPINNKNVSEIEIKDPMLFFMEGPKGQFYAPAQIDPDQKLVVYYSREGDGRWVVWDLNKQTELTHLPFFIAKDPFPPQDMDIPFDKWLISKGWSPKGNEFVNPVSQADDDKLLNLETPQELYSVNSKGETKRLTYLNSIYDFVQIAYLEWSPDAKQIAFWFQDDPKSAYKLGIYDFESRTVMDYCIESETQSSIAWSPDGKKLIVQPEKEYPNRRTILFDLENESKFLLPDIYNSFIIGGWVLDSK